MQAQNRPGQDGQDARLQQTFLLLQLTDPLLPIGGYAHSYGLETCIQNGAVHDTDSARLFLEKKLELGFLYGDLLPARLAWEAAQANSLEGLRELDELLAASRAPEELRQAGWKLGSRFLKTAAGMGIPLPPLITAYMTGGEGQCSYPVCFGAVCAALALPEEESLSHFLYAQTSAMVTCCVKLVPLRQPDGQQILRSLQPLMSRLVLQSLELDSSCLCLSAPGFDLHCMEHETLYSRLYMS